MKRIVDIVELIIGVVIVFLGFPVVKIVPLIVELGQFVVRIVKTAWRKW